MRSEESDESAGPIARAEAAYAAGDFASVRSQCAVLGAGSDAETAARARALARRLTPDPATWIAISVSFALFVGIVVTYAR